MENSENQDKGGDANNSANNYAKYSAVVFQMVAIIAVFAFGGYEIDKHMGNTIPYATALLCLVGVCLSIYTTIKQLTK
ncbi:AtpZ/AtpI family protein [uncultured Mucilaginibacter sp.]|uniref:AtpZ/AtpI family protein n=1 Tax=uncultured Mucilaginibacter sp. TaxID=797541 RepID=UPI0025F8CAF0|nr:AtpZ/AtpI family protein [uncultured Mucilaginibacter sp.]